MSPTTLLSRGGHIFNLVLLLGHPIFQCMLERTDTIMTEVLEPIRFVLAYPTVVSKYSPVFSALKY